MILIAAFLLLLLFRTPLVALVLLVQRALHISRSHIMSA
jgi:hypothetical protein